MLSKQATITLTSTDPAGVSVTLDELLQFVAAAKALGQVEIELHAGEIVAMGTEAAVVVPPTGQDTLTRPYGITINNVPTQRVAVDQ